MGKLSFRKGLLPIDGLDFAAGRTLVQERVLEIYSPREVLVPMLQHIGTPAVPCVAEGADVSIGQLIGRPSSRISLPVHATISGTVTAIETVTLSNGVRTEAVHIRSDNKRRYHASVARRANPERLSPKELSLLLLRSGIAGMGGEGYPAYAKCVRAVGNGVTRLYVNGLSSEPHLSCDLHLIHEQADRVILGALALGSCCQVREIFFCIQDSFKPEIAILRSALDRIRPMYPDRRLEMLVFRSRFPQGYERLLIRAATGVELEDSQLPENTVASVVYNVSTCAAFWDMVERNLPSVSRIITISDDKASVKNVLVPFGTLLSDLLERTPGVQTAHRIVVGGALTGASVNRLDIPITKQTQGVALIKEEHPVRTPCIHCGACVEACPVGLLPYVCNRLIELSDFRALAAESIDRCISCGACSYVCPAGIELSARIVRAAHSMPRKEPET